MTNQEFSDAFTTMLNSYNTQAQFGEQASKMEIVLNEYEKSVLLTQAQDIVTKSYFDSTLNQQGQGFDDSPRRQVDFSSLIKVAILDSSTEGLLYDDRGVMFKLPRKVVNNVIQEDTTDVLFILNEKLLVQKTTTAADGYLSSRWSKSGETDVEGDYTDTDAQKLGEYENIADAEKNGWSWTAAHYAVPPVKTTVGEYIIVPINYREYDREMSKPYAQPLKKQAWRLFQNSAVGFDVNTELIPKFNIRQSGDGNSANDITFVYKIRYVKRPRPIILENLPNNLQIDGEANESSCELNPILHIDILNKAVELALATRGRVQPPQQPQR